MLMLVNFDDSMCKQLHVMLRLTTTNIFYFQKFLEGLEVAHLCEDSIFSIVVVCFLFFIKFIIHKLFLCLVFWRLVT